MRYDIFQDVKLEILTDSEGYLLDGDRKLRTTCHTTFNMRMDNIQKQDFSGSL